MRTPIADARRAPTSRIAVNIGWYSVGQRGAAHKDRTASTRSTASPLLPEQPHPKRGQFPYSATRKLFVRGQGTRAWYLTHVPSPVSLHSCTEPLNLLRSRRAAADANEWNHASHAHRPRRDVRLRAAVRRAVVRSRRRARGEEQEARAAAAAANDRVLPADRRALAQERARGRGHGRRARGDRGARAGPRGRQTSRIRWSGCFQTS